MVRRICDCLALCCLIFTAAGAGYAQGWQHVENVERVEKRPDGVELISGGAHVRVTVFRPGIFRVRMTTDGNFPTDCSWAVIETPEPGAVKIEESAAEVRVSTDRGVALIQKSPLLIRFLDAAGKTLLGDEASMPMAWDGARIHCWKRMPVDENYFGLGDKAGPMERRNRAFTMWNTDAYDWQESTDPLYKTIPFFMGLRDGTAWGIFFDNTYRSSFDFGKESNDYFSFGAEGGELNYYFYLGPEPKTVLSEYTGMIGRAPLPPLWSLGFQQSRWSYFPEARVREIAELFREKKIPADVIYLDIDYENGDRTFTIDPQNFPHFEQMIHDLRAEGFHAVAITDLHIKKDPGYAAYDSGEKIDAFVKNPDGSDFVGPVWPGPSVFPDFTLTRVRDWWGGLYREFVGMGIAGFWNDMNEPAVFERADKTMPIETVHRLDDGTKLDHRAIHNIFGMENARATYDGLRKLQPDERPFVLARAAYAGAQRYAASWTGDNVSTWNHLGMSVPMLLSLGISGYPLVGADVGGFVGSPPADLLTRWIELGTFYPMDRDHTAKGTADQEPWVHGLEQEAIRRRYIELRYRLMPYIYTGVEEMSRTGVPLMRPIFLEFPEARDFYDENREFLFGRDLLVAPVLTEMVDEIEDHFPPGDWYDYWTGEKWTDAHRPKRHLQLDQLPLYARGGAIIPEQAVVQNTGEKPDGPLELRVYPGSDCGGSIYLDDGHTYSYEKGDFYRVKYSCEVESDSIHVISGARQGSFEPWWSKIEIEVFGATAAPKEIREGDKIVRDWHYDAEHHCVTFEIADSASGWNTTVRY
jgi:alpha-glucosidase